jgi:hypothetical protein
MHRVSFFVLPVAVLLAGLGCDAAGDVVVEVLPPRTSVTCAAPAKADAALGRGLFDVGATVDGHGAYIADLRLSVKGRDAHVDGVTLAYEVPGDAGGDVEDAAKDAGGDVVVGDVVLNGEGDDARVAVVENVQLVPRALALALRDDGDLGLSKVDFATLGITITPIVGGDDGGAGVSTFAVDLCDGCLFEPPDACAEEGESARNPAVCRVGQDVPLFTCTGGAP